MIILRRPFVAYDVDCLFGLGLIAIAAGVYAFFVVPAAAEDRSRTEQIVAIQANQMRLAARRQELQRYTTRTERLRGAIASRETTAPRTADLIHVINVMVNSAAECGLEIASVVPERNAQLDGRWVCDVRLTAAGMSNGVIRFLGRLSRDVPYHSVEQLTIAGRKDDAAICDVTVAIRLYLLPNAPTPPEGEPGE
jgi:hypothetical protein